MLGARKARANAMDCLEGRSAPALPPTSSGAASRSVTPTFIASDAIHQGASDDGERSLAGRDYETRQTPDPGVATPVGRGDGGAHDGEVDAGEPPLNLSAVLERFANNTRLRLKESSSQRDYRRAFARFARNGGLESFTRRQLAGPRGKALILAHLERIPLRSRRWTLAALRAVWMQGLGLPWPIDPKQDLGRLPRVDRRRTPPDTDVRPWARAISDEKDPYLRLLGLLLAQYGWRPGSQLARLKWRNVEYDPAGRPVAIVASGVDEGFKTYSSIVAWLPPDVVAAIEAWRKASPDSSPERPILPWRGTTRKVVAAREHNDASVRRLLKSLEAKWALPHLRPVDFRHFVATACRRAGLSVPASAQWQGHDPTNGGAMRDVYDNPDDTFAEQSARLPRGPLGLLEPVQVDVTADVSPGVLEVARELMAGRIGAIEAAMRLEALQRRTANDAILKP